MTDRFESRLSEYLDGELTGDESRLVERHLSECAACAETLAQLEAVTRRARDVGPKEPGQDLWPGIKARIEGADAPVAIDTRRREPRRISFSVPQLAAAAVILASLSAGTAWFAGGSSGAGLAEGVGTSDATPTLDPPVAGTLVSAPADAESLATAEYYAASISALEDMLFDETRPLPEETELRIRRALLTIDRAIEDARTALSEMPDDPYLQDRVNRTMKRKTTFLRDAIRMAAQS